MDNTEGATSYWDLIQGAVKTAADVYSTVKPNSAAKKTPAATAKTNFAPFIWIGAGLLGVIAIVLLIRR